MTLLIYNLLFNALGSFFIALVLVSIIRLVIPKRFYRLHFYLLILPFLKILFDIVISLLYPPLQRFNINMIHLNHHVHGVITVGAGLNNLGPMFNANFLINYANHRYLVSLGDLVMTAVHYIGGNSLVYVILIIVLTISWYKLAKHLFEFWSFSKTVKNKLQADGNKIILNILNGKRQIPCYISHAFQDTPFCSGLFHPFIVFPAEIYHNFTTEERNAAIYHEMGHIKKFDIIFVGLFNIVNDFFWFIPFKNIISNKIRYFCEIAADHYAISKGIFSLDIASCLLKVNKAQSKSILAFSSVKYFKKRFNELMVISSTQTNKKLHGVIQMIIILFSVLLLLRANFFAYSLLSFH